MQDEQVPVTQADREAVRAKRDSMSRYEQMADAQAQCVPCKLCGGRAVITDAGPGAGYYIACENGTTFRNSAGCMISERRLGGWAYNVMEWWNRLHRIEHSRPTTILPALKAKHRAEVAALLKAQIENGKRACLLAEEGSRRERDMAAGVVALERFADALASMGEK